MTTDANGSNRSLFEHILVPLDGSRYAERVLDYVADLAKLVGARVTLLTIPANKSPDPAVQSAEPATSQVDLEYLLRVASRLEAEGLSHVDTTVRPGSPVTVIVNVAREISADLIMMCTQGLSAEHDQGLGGVASGVLRSASCPVVMVRVSRPSPPRTPAEERWQAEGGANVG